MTTAFKETIRGFLPTGIKAHRIRRGPIAGRSICTSWHDYPGAIRGTTEAPLLAWFARNVKPGETWLDVGAHYGYTSIALATLVGETGRVVAFEPVLATAQCVTQTRDLNHLPQLQIVPLGLCAEGGIQIHRLPLYRGMADSTLSGRVPCQSILITSFDELWKSLSGSNPAVHGVKIDVQGMEDQVLAGMSEMLRDSHPRLVIEFHTAVDADQILAFLEACGYSRSAEPIDARSPAIEPDKSYAFSSYMAPFARQVSRL